MANLEGFNTKFLVTKVSDVGRLKSTEIIQLGTLLEKIEKSRESEGKQPNKYLVINTNESYADEVIEILKRHGQWGE